jgi:hypothetical protein
LERVRFTGQEAARSAWAALGTSVTDPTTNRKKQRVIRIRPAEHPSSFAGCGQKISAIFRRKWWGLLR